jgi:hypothetical protein
MKNPALLIHTADPEPYVVHADTCGCDQPAVEGAHHVRVGSLAEIEDPDTATWWFRPRAEAPISA